MGFVWNSKILWLESSPYSDLLFNFFANLPLSRIDVSGEVHDWHQIEVLHTLHMRILVRTVADN